MACPYCRSNNIRGNSEEGKCYSCGRTWDNRTHRSSFDDDDSSSTLMAAAATAAIISSCSDDSFSSSSFDTSSSFDCGGFDSGF